MSFDGHAGTIEMPPGTLGEAWEFPIPRHDCEGCHESGALRNVSLSYYFYLGTTEAPADTTGLAAMQALFAATDPAGLWDAGGPALQNYAVTWDAEAEEAVIVALSPGGASARNDDVTATAEIAGVWDECKTASKPGWTDGLAWRAIDGLTVKCGYKTFAFDGVDTTYGTLTYVDAAVSVGDTEAFADDWIGTGVPAAGTTAGITPVDAYAPNTCVGD